MYIYINCTYRNINYLLQLSGFFSLLDVGNVYSLFGTILVLYLFGTDYS